MPTDHEELLNALIHDAAREHEVPEGLLKAVLRLEEVRSFELGKEPRTKFRDIIKEWTAKT